MAAQAKPVDAAKWIGLGLAAWVAVTVLDKLSNIFAGLGAPGASGKLPALPGASYTPSHYAMLSERIYAAVWTSELSEDERAVMRALAEMRNDADVVALFNAYGMRSGPYLFDQTFNLVGTVRNFLSADELAAVNTFFHRRGINAQF